MLKRPTIALPVQPPDFVAREFNYPRRDIWILLAVCGVIRLIFLPINQAEYTDGVLQVWQFVFPTGIWPPLYGALVYPLKFIFGFMWSGRIISAVASTLALYPIYRMSQRAFGTRAALYAGVFYIVAPVANRWGIRMMSDATFSLFFWWACERLYFASDERIEKKAMRAFTIGCIFTVFATLTRYQGIILVPPVLIIAYLLKRRFRRWPIKSLLWLAGFAVVGIWISLTPDTFIHDEQFRSRALESQAMPLGKVLALNAEAFVLFMPYYLTYPVAVMTLVGMFWVRQRRGPAFGWMVTYIAVVLLLLQSAFSSFQERYFLPLMGFFWILAGAGLYALEERWLRRGRPFKARIFPYIVILTYVYSFIFTLFVLFGQRQIFGDIAEASRFAAEISPADQPIYTNELYRPEPFIAGVKVEFFGEHETNYLHESFFRYEGDPLRGMIPRPPANRLEPGSIIVLSSVYGAEQQARYLNQYYRMEQLGTDDTGQTLFTARVLPLLPDVMATWPGGQNPLSWHYRYDWQDFETYVYRIEGER